MRATLVVKENNNIVLCLLIVIHIHTIRNKAISLQQVRSDEVEELTVFEKKRRSALVFFTG